MPEIHTELFLKLIEGVNEADIEVELIEDEENYPNKEQIVTIISGHKINQKEAFMVIKRGKMIGWEKL